MAITTKPDKAILASVSYTEVAASTSWVDVSVFAAVTVPDVLSVEVITPTDLVSLRPIKGFIDGFFANTDYSYRGFLKGVSETLTTAEIVTILIVVTREFTDTVAGVDDFYTSVISKVFSDSVAPSEQLAVSVEKPLSDASLVDSLYSGHPALELYSIYPDYTLPYPEPAYFSQDYTAGQKTEVVTVSDFFTSERIYGRFVVDTVNLGDVGVLSMQSYSDLTYFSQDYVGVGRIL